MICDDVISDAIFRSVTEKKKRRARTRDGQRRAREATFFSLSRDKKTPEMKEISTLDFTYKAENESPEKVLSLCKEYFKKWVFQLEKSDTGYLHFQGRGRLVKRRTLPSCISVLGPVLPGLHLSASSTNSLGDSTFSYVMKTDTRVAGPWKDDDPEPAPLTRQLRDFMTKEKYPWQSFIEESVKELDDRYIKVVIDNVGNIGKSVFVEYLEYNGLAYEIPAINCLEDLMQIAMCIPAQKAYLIDMPRGLKKEKLAGMYAGLEALKNGTMYDKRYAFKKRRIDRPQVIVFTNVKPDVSLLSLDRWIFYNITPDMGIEKIETITQ